MDNDIHFEALETLIRKQKLQIDELSGRLSELSEEEERHFQTWTDIVVYLGKTNGEEYVSDIARKAIENESYKAHVLDFIHTEVEYW